MIDLNDIKPKVRNKSDKYSWYLYNFLNKLFKTKDIGKYYQNQMEIHWLHDSRWDGGWLDAPTGKDQVKGLNLHQLLILPAGRKHGRTFYHISSILQKGKSEHFSLPSKWSTTDITDWFFENYKRDGRCVFDREHIDFMRGTENRFTYVNNTRRCNWCGEWHTKEIKKEVKIKRRVKWV